MADITKCSNSKKCKNCKYHYKEEISFDYPQSCCSKEMATTEEWCTCNAFEYSDRYIEQLQQENQELKEKYENAVADYETTMAEKEQLKNQLKDKTEDYNRMKDNFDSKVDVLTKIETQQNEFINYLEKEIENSTFLKFSLEMILQKYRSIIGGKE